MNMKSIQRPNKQKQDGHQISKKQDGHQISKKQDGFLELHLVILTLTYVLDFVCNSCKQASDFGHHVHSCLRLNGFVQQTDEFQDRNHCICLGVSSNHEVSCKKQFFYHKCFERMNFYFIDNFTVSNILNRST